MLKKFFLFILLISKLMSLSVEEKMTIIKSTKLIDQGYYQKALVLLNKTLNKYSKNDQLLTLKAKALKELNQLSKSKILLQKALEINPDNRIARALIKEIEDIQKSRENEAVKRGLELLSNKGLRFLFIFFGVLGGELLVNSIKECRSKEDEVKIKNFVYSILENKMVKLKSLKCKGIDWLVKFIIAISWSVVILLIEFLIEPPYLKYITVNGLYAHIFAVFIVILFALFVVKKFNQKQETLIDVVDMLTSYLHNNNHIFLRKALKTITLLEKEHKEVVEQIFDNILIEEDRKKIMQIYQHIKHNGG